MFPYKESVIAFVHEPSYVGSGENAALADLDHIPGHLRGKEDGDTEGYAKRPQIAVVHPDDLSARGDGGFQLVQIVNLYERGHAKLGRELAERPQLGLVEYRGDQKNGVGAGCRGFQDVIFGDGEVL